MNRNFSLINLISIIIILVVVLIGDIEERG